MNKPTREQIEHKAIELLLNNPIASVRWALEEAELMLSKPRYFKNDESRLYFQKQLADLIGATDHRYKYFEKSTKPVLHMKFYIDKNEFDTISGVWGVVYDLNYNMKYSIKELLG